MAKAPLSQTLILTEDGSTITMTAALAVTIPPIVVDLPPMFTSLPSIGTDGNPTVGEIVALDFGAIVGDTIGTRQILRADNSVVATVDTGSYQLDAAGQIKLRVFAANTAGLYAETPLITVVAAAVVSAITAPSVAFAVTNDDGSPYAAGTNPWIIEVGDTDGTIDKASDSIVIEWDYQAGGAFQSSANRRLVINNLRAVADAETVTVSPSEASPAGPLRVEVYVDGPAGRMDGGPAAQSPRTRVTTTLNAASLPPATTKWDDARKSQYMTTNVSNGDGLEAKGLNPANAAHGVLADTARTDARFFELTVLEVESQGDFTPCIAPSETGSLPDFGFPAGSVGANMNGAVVGDVFTVRVIPKIGANNGSLYIAKNGVDVAGPLEVDYSSYTILYSTTRGYKARLNTGQAAFAFKPAGNTYKQFG